MKGNMPKGYYIFLAILLGTLLVLDLLLMIIYPILIIFEIFIGICEYVTIKKIKRINEDNLKRENKEKELIKLGYKKICNDLFLDNTNKKVNIYGKDYGFSQIIDCELIENSNTTNNTFGTSKGKIKNNGKIKMKSNAYSMETAYCNELYINIIIDDLNNPNIKLDLRDKGIIIVGSKKYKENYDNANNVLSTLKLIIAKSKEKYIENGTITKVEHKYINEKSIEEKIQALGKLYKDGILTEYEFSIKKQELLDKIN